MPGSLAGTIGEQGSQACNLDSATLAKVDIALGPYLELMAGAKDSEAAGVLYVIGGRCRNTCGAEVAHGYSKLAQALGGCFADVCDKDVGVILRVIIDSHSGGSCLCTLDRRPINTSLTVSFNGMALPRSRVAGFDYRPATNSVLFINNPKARGSEVVIGYRRWDSSGS